LHRGEFDTAERTFHDLHERAARHALNYGNHFYAPQAETLLRARGSLRYMRYVAVEPPAVSTAIDDAPRAYALFTAGRVDECWKLVDRFAREAFEQVPKNRSYLWALSQLALATAEIEHPTAAQQLYALLRGYPDHNAVAPHGFSMGSVACFAGILADKLGQTQDAIAHLGHAIARNDATGQPAQSARARYALSRALAATRSQALQKRARVLAAEAKATAEQLDMQPLLRELQALIATL